MNSKLKPTQGFISISLIIIAFSLIAATQKSKKQQPELKAKSVRILEVEGYRFKDLNRNGKLDIYEDWRLSSDKRAKDLLSQMTIEEKAGFMLINSLNMVGARAAEESGGKLNASDLSESGNGGFGQFRTGNNNENNGSNGRNAERERLQNPEGAFIANMNRNAGTSKMVKGFHNRHFILRANESVAITAEWANKLQELCEGERLGIPAIIASNPRNHITTNASFGTSVGVTVFTAWPGELGLSAMRDLSLVHEFADNSRQEWAAVGLRKGYMYMADLSTEPRWSRINGTFGENARWVAKMTREIVIGFQGKKLNRESVALTTKHFPGGGAGKDGQDSHFEWGKAEIFPGGMFGNNLIPFKAAIKAGTSSVMPYYSLPQGTQYEEVGYAFNKAVIHDLLRNQMGFKGIINSDTGPLTSMPWGVEKLTKQERYKKALEAGVNLFSGESDPTDLLEIIKNGSVDISLIDDSILRLLKEKFELGLFENPYVDVAKAEKIVNNDKFRQNAALAMRKSIVLLRNESKTLPLKEKTRVYVETLRRKSDHSASGNADVYTPDKPLDNIQFVNTPDKADIAIFWLQPEGISLFRSTGEPVSVSLSKCGIDVAHINSVSASKKTVLVINYTNPWVIDEVYNQGTKNIAGVIATFGTTFDALLDVVTGKFNPSGKMPFSTPVSDKAVENNLEDVPGYLEGKEYALFHYNEGLHY